MPAVSVYISPRARIAEGATVSASRGLVVRVGDPSAMHDLCDDRAALVVDGVGHLAPAFDLRGGDEARRAAIALAVGLG